MKQNQASQTAQYMALFRACESSRPSNQRLFADPFALDFLKPSLRLAAQLSHFPLLATVLTRYIDWRWPGARTSGIARTRLIDDYLLKALKSEGTEQVVLLGAGFDSRAYRLKALAPCHVFEIDQPATLRTKRQLLQKKLNILPANVTFVEVDFNRQSLAQALTASTFDPTLPTFFIWEGVTNYLSQEAVDATLNFISTCTVKSRLLFTYVHQGALDGSLKFEGSAKMAHTVKKVGEPWTFGLNPSTLGNYLAQRNLRLLEDLGSTEYRTRYLGAGGRHLRGYEFYRIALVQPGNCVSGQFDE